MLLAGPFILVPRKDNEEIDPRGGRAGWGAKKRKWSVQRRRERGW